MVQNVLDAIKTGKPYPVNAVFIIGSDVLASQSPEWREAFKKVDFVVKSHVWPDDDTDYTDIVLPEAAFLERDDGFAPSRRAGTGAAQPGILVPFGNPKGGRTPV